MEAGDVQAKILAEVNILAGLAHGVATSQTVCAALDRVAYSCRLCLQHTLERAASTGYQPGTSSEVVFDTLLRPLLRPCKVWAGKDDGVVLSCLRLLTDVASQTTAACALTRPQLRDCSKSVVDLVGLKTSMCATAACFRLVSMLFEGSQEAIYDAFIEERVIATLMRLQTASTAPGGPPSNDSAAFAVQVFGLGAMGLLTQHSIGVRPRDPEIEFDVHGTVRQLVHFMCADQGNTSAVHTPTMQTPGCNIQGHGPGLHASVTQEDILAAFVALPLLLLVHTGQLNSGDKSDGCTILHRLAEANLVQCMEVFLQAAGSGIDIHKKNMAGDTALDIATSRNNSLCAELLKSVAGQSVLDDRPARNFWQQHPTMRASGAPKELPELPPPLGTSPPFSDFGFMGVSKEQVEAIARSEGRSGLVKIGSSRTLSALAASHKANQALSQGSSLLGGQPDAGPMDRKRIVQIALAQLEQSSDGTSEGQQDVVRPATFSEPYSMAELGSSMRHPSNNQLFEGSLIQSGSDFEPVKPQDSRTLEIEKARQHNWEGISTPSTRIWLGNIAAHVTVRALHNIFGQYGRLADAAVFPARIGPLGYAFVNFSLLECAIRAFDALNNSVIPALTGCKQLKMRFKPAQASARGEAADSMAPQPSLWLGNIPLRPNKFAIEDVFGRFGRVASVRVFPGKTFAFVNYDNLASATEALNHLDGVVFPAVSGAKPMVVRYQAGAPGAVSEAQLMAPILGRQVSFGRQGPGGPMTANVQMPERQSLVAPSSLFFGSSPSSQPGFVAGPKDRRACTEMDTSMQRADSAHETNWGLSLADRSTSSMLSGLSLQAVRHGSLEAPGSLNIRGALSLAKSSMPELHSMHYGSLDAHSSFGQGGRQDSNQARLDECVRGNFKHARHGSLEGLTSSPVTLFEVPARADLQMPRRASAGESTDSHFHAALAALDRSLLDQPHQVPHAFHPGEEQPSYLVGEAPLPAINLSNRLNPNNIHYDRVLAAQYKNMTKLEKEALWAQDRLLQQAQSGNPSFGLAPDISLLALAPNNPSLQTAIATQLANWGPYGHDLSP